MRISHKRGLHNIIFTVREKERGGSTTRRKESKGVVAWLNSRAGGARGTDPNRGTAPSVAAVYWRSLHAEWEVVEENSEAGGRRRPNLPPFLGVPSGEASGDALLGQPRGHGHPEGIHKWARRGRTKRERERIE